MGDHTCQEEGEKDTPDDLSNVGRDEVSDELLGVLVDRAALLDGGLDCRKVIVSKNHVAGELGDVGSGAHGDSDCGSSKSGCIVDSVSSLSKGKASSANA